MKKLSVLLLLAVVTTSVYAQNSGRSPLRFGLKAGGNLSHGSIKDDDYDNLKNKFGFGFYGGGLMEVSGPAGSKFKGQVEALFNLHNFSSEYNFLGSSITGKTTLSQISVPVMLKYFITPRFSINAGPSVNFNLAGKTKVETEILSGVVNKSELDLKDLDVLQTIQIGALAGATFYIHKGFFVDARYNYYFGSALKDDYGKMNVSAIQLGLGYKF